MTGITQCRHRMVLGKAGRGACGASTCQRVTKIQRGKGVDVPARARILQPQRAMSTTSLATHGARIWSRRRRQLPERSRERMGAMAPGEFKGEKG